MSNTRRASGAYEVLTGYAYIKPRRVYARGLRVVSGVTRSWLRYTIVETTLTRLARSVKHSKAAVTVLGYAWTKRQAERMVNELRRAA